MPEEQSGSFSRILSGSAVIFLGAILHKFIAFGGSVFNAQLLGPSGYGVIVVALSVYFILCDILSLGLNSGVARNYSQSDPSAVRRGVLTTAYQLATITAVVGAIAVFVAAGPVAEYVFQDESIAPALRILAVAIPLKIFLNLINGTLQGVKKPLVKTVVTSILQPVVRISLIVSLVLLGYGAIGVAGAYLGATAVTAVVSLYYVRKHTELFEFGTDAVPVHRSLLRFSVPLVGSSIILKFMNNLDTILIGTFATSADAGGYNVAFVLGQTTLLFIESIAFMYLPEVSDLYKEGALEQVSDIYRTVTKWVVFLSAPFVLTALAFPNYVLTFIYSANYGYATTAFVILVVGFSSHILNGPNRGTLVAFGKTRRLLGFDLGTLAANFALNVVLIPRFGIAGAAVATGSSYLLRNAMMTWYLNREFRIIPFSQALLFPLIPLAITAVVVRGIVPSPSVLSVIIYTAVLTITLALGYLSMGVEETDLLLAELLEEQGIDLDIVRRVHERVNRP
ncbi:flippase [Halobaculum halobium]|uniref:Flippase n=1 Tax=Halobaculum halobium TaxID=3032281 RepID=A0ABD5TD14_9EURY|nr:flippase [Halobaculum sp. SYNS20]